MKKILILSDTPTHPVTGGNRACILSNAEFLKESGFEVFFLYVDTKEVSDESVVLMRNYWKDHFFCYNVKKTQQLYQKIVKRIHPESCRKIDFYYPWGLTNYINKINRDYCFDGLLINYIWMSKAYKSKIKIKALYTHDVFSYRDERIRNWDWKYFPVSEEAKGIRRIKNILAIQDIESVFFKYIAPLSKTYSVYSPINFVNQDFVEGKNVLFFSGGGKLNLDGITRFINNVWNRVREQIPDAVLLIGGGICNSLKIDELPRGVELKGRFDNPDEFYALGNVAINPVFSGTGLKIKTIEALSYGKITIVSPHSAEGIYQGVKAPLIIAKTDEEYANSVIESLNVRDINEVKELCEKYVASLNCHISNVYNSIFNK